MMTFMLDAAKLEPLCQLRAIERLLPKATK